MLLPENVVFAGSVVGNRAAANVPDEMLAALVASTEQEAAAPAKSAQDGCEACGAPEVEMLSSHSWETAQGFRSRPSSLAPGGGRSAPTIARGATAPAKPLGDARNRFATCETPVTANVPAA